MLVASTAAAAPSWPWERDPLQRSASLVRPLAGLLTAISGPVLLGSMWTESLKVLWILTHPQIKPKPPHIQSPASPGEHTRSLWKQRVRRAPRRLVPGSGLTLLTMSAQAN